MPWCVKIFCYLWEWGESGGIFFSPAYTATWEQGVQPNGRWTALHQAASAGDSVHFPLMSLPEIRGSTHQLRKR